MRQDMSAAEALLKDRITEAQAWRWMVYCFKNNTRTPLSEKERDDAERIAKMLNSKQEQAEPAR